MDIGDPTRVIEAPAPTDLPPDTFPERETEAPDPDPVREPETVPA